MKTVKQVLQGKPSGGAVVHSVSPAASVLDAIKLMAEKGVGALVVLDQARLAGVGDRVHAVVLDVSDHDAVVEQHTAVLLGT